MAKQSVLTRDQKRKIREEKELKRLLKAKNTPKFIGYLFFFLFVVTVVYLTDEISTNIGKFTELEITTFFFKKVDSDTASSVRSLVNTCVSIIAGVSMLLRPLADRYGRKLFLVIYTLGMGIGMSLIATANGIGGWLVGTLMIQMCIPHDMQQIYIQECAPKEKRGTYFFLVKGLATIGLLIVPLLKLVFGSVTNGFKLVYGITAFVGLAAAILAAIFIRESDVFIDTRIKQLQMSEEERAQALIEKKDEAKRGGIVAGFGYVFKNKQLKWICISFMLIMFSYVLTDNYSTTIAVGYLTEKGLTLESSNYELQEVLSYTNQAILTYPVGCGLIVLLPGFISDRIGRKFSAIVFGLIALILYVLFFIGCRQVWSPYLLGCFIGAACGSVWSCGDLALMMTTESSSTNMRASANAITLLLAGLMYFIGQILVGAIGSSTGDYNLPFVTIGAVVTGLTIGLVIMMFKVHETKGTDLEDVKPADFVN